MLTFAEALERAIEAERQGAAFYRMLAGLFAQADARAFLHDMAAEEEEHAGILAGMAAGGTRAAVDWEHVLALHTHEPDPDPMVGEGELSLREAVDIALEAERHAAWTYASMGAETEGETQELFTRLALTEQRHAQVLERLLSELDAQQITPFYRQHLG
jgi:rubrerythrin